MLNKDYRIIEGTLEDLEEFERRVANCLNDGYVPVGRPFVVDKAIFQAMVSK
jgi:hypothetical protein